jgi:energy-coupling factor transporter ATP-binding protein EcfA2
MFLRELTIENLRSIENTRISFQADSGNARKWTFIVGENGCGKSTVLRAAALVLVGSDALPSVLGEIDSWVRFNAKQARISATIVTVDGEERNLSLVIRRGAGLREIFDNNRETLELLDSEIRGPSRNYLTLGYGASRRLNNDPESSFKRPAELPPRAKAVTTLFSAEASLEPLESWVIDMDYQKTLDAAGMLRKIVNSLMPDVEFHSIDKQNKQLLFKTRDGITALTRLTGGYQNVAAWCVDLLRSVTTIFRDHEDPLGARGRPALASGLATPATLIVRSRFSQSSVHRYYILGFDSAAS